MTAPARKSPPRDSVLNVRVPSGTRDMIDAAAAVVGQTRTEFGGGSARNRAIDVLLDPGYFALDEEQWRAFTAALDEPAPPNDALVRLMGRKAPWEA